MRNGQTEQIHPQTFDDPFFFFDSTGMIYMHWVPIGQTVNKEYYVKVLREFRKRFLEKRLALFKSAQWHFHQDNAAVHNSILVTDYLTKMGIFYSVCSYICIYLTQCFLSIYLSVFLYIYIYVCVCVYVCLVWFGFFSLKAYQLFVGYLMPKPFS